MQSYGGSVTLRATDTLNDYEQTRSISPVPWTATTGVQVLTVSAGAGPVTFGGAVGGSKALANLTVTGAGPATLDGNVYDHRRAELWRDGDAGALLLRRPYDDEQPGDFLGTVDAATAGGDGLKVNAGTGAAIFGSTVGASQALRNPTVTWPWPNSA